MFAAGVEARLKVQLNDRPKALSTVAQLLASLVDTETGKTVLPVLTCAVKQLGVDRSATDVHLLLFDHDPGEDPSRPDRLLLKHCAKQRGPSRQALSFQLICPLIDSETATFPRVEAIVHSNMGEIMVLEYIATRRSRIATQAPPAFERPRSTLAPSVDPGVRSESVEDAVTSNIELAEAVSTAKEGPDLASFDLPAHTKEDYHLAVTALGRLHAPFFGNDDLLDALCAAHPFLNTPLANPALRPDLAKEDAEALGRRLIALAPKLLPDTEQYEWTLRLIREMPIWRAACASLLPKTLLLGNACMDNMIVRDVALTLDQQEAVMIKPNFIIGSPLLDVALFAAQMWTSHAGHPLLEPAEVLNAYLASLREQGVEWMQEKVAEHNADVLARCMQVEMVIMLLWIAVDMLGKRSEHSYAISQRILGYVKDVEPSCRKTVDVIRTRIQLNT